jgi:hypothetical protein
MTQNVFLKRLRLSTYKIELNREVKQIYPKKMENAHFMLNKTVEDFLSEYFSETVDVFNVNGYGHHQICECVEVEQPYKLL